MKLLLIDGSNLVMRASLGGALSPDMAVTNATGLVRRAADQSGATHLVIALDLARSLGGPPTWRQQRFPDYKANRTTDTSPYLIASHAGWSRLGWWVEGVPGFEADDVLATLALRAVGPVPSPGGVPPGQGTRPTRTVTVCSGDSDLLPLVAHGVMILKPVNGGRFEDVTAADVCRKYHVATPDLLRDLKALTGEDGDNIPGVPGIGPVRAARLLAEFNNVGGVLVAARNPGPDRDLLKVAQHRAAVELALELVTLRTDAPVPPIRPGACAFPPFLIS